MPDVVTFDPVNLRIIEIDAAGDNELDVVEIYSEWKAWQLLSDNAKHPPAFRFVGGDPISPTQDLGSTFFLTNGWKIRPAESSHKLTLVGNIFTDPAGESVFVNTLGAFTVNTETRVSNLTDSSVARLDLVQLLQQVFIDPTNGTAGTAEGIGVPTKPSDNIADARIIANRDNLFSYAFRESLTLDQNHDNWFFEGISSEANDVINLGGFSVDRSRFKGCTLAGTMTGFIEVVESLLNVVLGLDGTVRRSGLAGNLSTAANANLLLDSCFSQEPGSPTPNLAVGSNSSVNIRNYSGGLELETVTAGTTVSVDLDPGKVILNANCTGGTVLVRGIGELINNSTGTTVIDQGLIDPNDIRIARQMLAGNITISADKQTITVLDKDNATTLAVFNLTPDGLVRTRTA